MSVDEWSLPVCDYVYWIIHTHSCSHFCFKCPFLGHCILIVIWGRDFRHYASSFIPKRLCLCLLGIPMSVYPILTLFCCHNVILLLYWGQSNSCSLLNGADSVASARWLILCVFSLTVSLFIYFVLGFLLSLILSLYSLNFFFCNFTQ